MSVLKFRNQETGEWQEIQTIKGDPGKDGRTPVKGVDYFDGAPGKDGADGYTPQKGVDYFDGEPGKDGKDGVDGKDGADYVLTAADKQEIASMIEGGGGGNANTVILEFNGDSASPEALAILQDYYAYYKENKTLPPMTLIAHSTWYPDNYYYITNVYINNYSFTINGAYFSSSLGIVSSTCFYGFAPISNGSFNQFYFYQEQPQSTGGKDWHWRDEYGVSNVYVGDYSHVKLVFVSNNDSSELITFDVCTSHGNTFNTEMGSHYRFAYPDWITLEIRDACFYNQGGTLDVSIPEFTFLGFYRWGNE